MPAVMALIPLRPTEAGGAECCMGLGGVSAREAVGGYSSTGLVVDAWEKQMVSNMLSQPERQRHAKHGLGQDHCILPQASEQGLCYIPIS